MTLHSWKSQTIGVALLAAVLAGVGLLIMTRPGGTSQSVGSTGKTSATGKTLAFASVTVGSAPGTAGDKGAALRALRRNAVATDRPLWAVDELAGSSRRVAQSNGDASARSVFVGKAVSGMVCLVLQGSDIGGGGGCNAAADPFAGSTVWFSSNHVGGPLLPEELTIFGVASDDVHRIEVSVGNATLLRPALTTDGGFVVVLPASRVGHGNLDVTIAAFGDGDSPLGTVRTQLHLDD